MLKTYITHIGFSYVYSDLWLSDEIKKEIFDVIDKTYNKINELVFYFQAEDGIRDKLVTGVQTCALPISSRGLNLRRHRPRRSSPRDGPRCRRTRPGPAS